MKNQTIALFTAMLLFTAISSQAQIYRGTIENHTKGEMDNVLILFGLDRLVKIGALKADGSFEIDLSKNPAENLSKEDREVFISKLSYGFEFGCANPDDFPEGEPKIASDARFVALWKDNTWAGSLFPVSDKKLQPWLDDNGYQDAVQGWFYKVLLLTQAVDLQKKCTHFEYYDEKDIKVQIEFDLKLKKGLNLVQYQLKSIYKTNPNVRAAFPDSVRITNADNLPIIWVAKYFY